MMEHSDQIVKIGWEKRGFLVRGIKRLKPTKIIRRKEMLFISKYSDNVLQMKGNEWKISGSEVKSVYSIDKRSRLVRTFGAGLLGVIILGTSFLSGIMDYIWMGMICLAVAFYHFWLGHYKILVIETVKKRIEIESWDDDASMQALRNIISNAVAAGEIVKEKNIHYADQENGEENVGFVEENQIETQSDADNDNTIYCTYCGMKNNAVGIYCTRCGKKLYVSGEKIAIEEKTEGNTDSKEDMMNMRENEVVEQRDEDLEKIFSIKNIIQQGRKISNISLSRNTKKELAMHCWKYLQKQTVDWNRIYQEFFPEKAIEKQDWTEFAEKTFRKRLEKGYFLLQEKDWKEAEEVFDKVLDEEWKCAEAHLGKYLAYRQRSILEEDILDQDNKYYQRCLKFADVRLKQYLDLAIQRKRKCEEQWIYLFVLDDMCNKRLRNNYYDFQLFLGEMNPDMQERMQEHLDKILKEHEKYT